MAVLKGAWGSREVGEKPLRGQGSPFLRPRPCPIGREGGLWTKGKRIWENGHSKGGTMETKMEKDE